jgi:L-lactate dehydrogenase complex protein LldG
VTARDEVLARVRSALVSRPPGEVDVDRGYREGTDGPSGAALLDLFAERVADYRATVRRCAADELPGVLAEVLGEERVVVPPDLPWEVPGAERDSGQSALQLDEIDAVVTAAALGVAVPGTIVLDHRPDQGRRALTLVPDHHVCVVRADQVVATVPEAVARLDPARPLTWISGPSATSDIELSRVEGVHGPRRLDVILLDPGTH